MKRIPKEFELSDGAYELTSYPLGDSQTIYMLEPKHPSSEKTENLYHIEYEKTNYRSPSGNIKPFYRPNRLVKPSIPNSQKALPVNPSVNSLKKNFQSLFGSIRMF
jgi:hypothetical protein